MHPALSVRHDVDRVLFAFLEGVRNGAPDAAPLVEEIERLLRLGGKRLRPAFCYWGYVAGGGDPSSERISQAAGALELLHTFAIVHDDVMDGSAVRRGAPSTWRRLGTGPAILAGDLALVLADRLMTESGFSHDRLGSAVRLFDDMRIEAIGGQFRDLLATRHEGGETEARRIARLKSGGYTVRYPLVIGAALAGAGPDVHDGLTGYGVPLGEAFQIRDDLLGVFGDPERTGKDVDSDLREGKFTVLVAKTLARVSGDDLEFVRSRLGRPDLSEAEAERTRALMRATRAVDDTARLIEDLTAEALDALERAPIRSSARDALRELAVVATSRDT